MLYASTIKNLYIYSIKSRMSTSIYKCYLLLVGFLIIISNGVIDAKTTQSRVSVEFIKIKVYYP